jgi:hypothetical protein
MSMVREPAVAALAGALLRGFLGGAREQQGSDRGLLGLSHGRLEWRFDQLEWRNSVFLLFLQSSSVGFCIVVIFTRFSTTSFRGSILCSTSSAHCLALFAVFRKLFTAFFKNPCALQLSPRGCVGHGHGHVTTAQLRHQAVKDACLDCHQQKASSCRVGSSRTTRHIHSIHQDLALGEVAAKILFLRVDRWRFSFGTLSSQILESSA